MPASLPSVPLLEQELRSSCVAACARMVLEHFGITHAEAELRTLLGTSPEGTDFGQLREMTSLGMEVRFHEAHQAFLEYWLGAGVPPIVALDTGFLGHWAERCPHTAVVVGSDDAAVTLNDPAFPDAPRVVPLAEFLRAWEENELM